MSLFKHSAPKTSKKGRTEVFFRFDLFFYSKIEQISRFYSISELIYLVCFF